MVVLILENVPPSLRGDLSRWMIEPQAGIFLGRMTARIRDELWKKAVAGRKAGACLQMWSAPTEQGFQWRSFGDCSRSIGDYEGLYLVEKPRSVP